MTAHAESDSPELVFYDEPTTGGCASVTMSPPAEVLYWVGGLNECFACSSQSAVLMVRGYEYNRLECNAWSTEGAVTNCAGTATTASLEVNLFYGRYTFRVDDAVDPDCAFVMDGIWPRDGYEGFGTVVLEDGGRTVTLEGVRW